MRSWVLAAAFVALGWEVAAETQCERDRMVDMASEILAMRGDLTGFAGSRLGGDAAYFMLRQGRMSAAEVLVALQKGRPYRQADEIILSHRITALGPEGVALWGGDLRDILSSAPGPVHRAILLLDNGETYFKIVEKIETDAERAEQFSSLWFNGANLHAWLTDQPPDVYQKIAERAEAEGYFVVAASLYAMMPEGAYEQFWERVNDSDSELIELANPLKMNENGTIALERDIALPNPDEFEGIERRLARQQLLLVRKASMAEGDNGFIQISVNQTGRLQEMAVVSERFLRAIDAGKIDPQRRPEEGWAFLLSAMIDVLGANDVEALLNGFNIRADYRHYSYSGLSLDVLQMATAAEAAGPWLREEFAVAPEKPSSLSQSFDWPQALAVWSLVKSGGQLPQEALSGTVLSLAVEGHLQRGEFDEALFLSERAGGINQRLLVARDIMLRQNRLCDQLGIMPGAAVLLGGQLLYDFQ